MIRRTSGKIKKLIISVKSKTSSSTFPVKRAPPIIVHLGNVGLSSQGEELCAKTKKFAERFKGMNFVGIDIRGASSTQRNWKQMKLDAIKGLERLDDNSVSIIRSEMALGYYTEQIISADITESIHDALDYSRKAMTIACRKLKPNGKLVIVADRVVSRKLSDLAQVCGFRRVTSEPVKNPSAISFWTNAYGKNQKVDWSKTMTTLSFYK